MKKLEGKVAVITGAGSGMAKASVKVFVREGAKVIAADISGAQDDTAAEVGNGVVAVRCDVTKEADVEAMIRAAVDEALVAKETGEEKVILFNYSGHGFLDLAAYDDFNHGRLIDA